MRGPRPTAATVRSYDARRAAVPARHARYVKILDEEDPKAADVISAILGDVA
jgi:hypothetical protein